MNAHVEELAKEIRSLPEESRLYLLDQLNESLEVAEVESAWEVELKRRVDAVQSGRVIPVSDAQVMTELEVAARE
ncbi:MAG: putative addiction module component [Verrucomicrobiota bacterium]|jgi:putative addiction module component (TIGR02574 family)